MLVKGGYLDDWCGGCQRSDMLMGSVECGQLMTACVSPVWREMSQSYPALGMPPDDGG